MIQEKMIYGVHAVREALESATELDKIYLKKGTKTDETAHIVRLASEAGVPVLQVPVERLNRFTRKSHQGVIALLSPITYTPLEEMVASLFESGESPFVVVLDGITDVRNFGAIARTCECAGVDAIVIPDKGSVSVTADAVNASAGALLHLPVCRVKNLHLACKYLKECGLQLVGASEKSSQMYHQSPLAMPIALVLGAEDKGLSPAVVKLLDRAVAIPLQGSISSLNVSVAAGVLLYEIVRQNIKTY